MGMEPILTTQEHDVVYYSLSIVLFAFFISAGSEFREPVPLMSRMVLISGRKCRVTSQWIFSFTPLLGVE
jgi:hypothetical protein